MTEMASCIKCGAMAALHRTGKCRACRVIKCSVRECHERFLQIGTVKTCVRHRKYIRKRSKVAVCA